MKKTHLTLFFLFCFYSAMAQDSKNHTPNLPDYSNSKEITPIDGGVGFLLATGVGYGIQKMRKKIKEGI